MYTLPKKVSFAPERLQPRVCDRISDQRGMHDARASHSADGLVLIREVCGDHLRSAGYRTCVASYESERLLPGREEFDRFIAYNAASSEDRDHVRCARFQEEAGASYSFRLRL